METVIPDAARKQEEEGEKIREEMYKEGSGKEEGILDDNPAPDPDAIPDPDDVSGDDAPVKDDDPNLDDPKEDLKDKGGADDDPAPDDKAKGEDFEQKFKVLEGKYKAEVPRLTTEVKYLERELRDRDAKILVLEQAVKETPKKEEPVADTPDLKGAMDVLGRELGEDVMGAIKALVAGNKQPVVDGGDLKDRMSKVESDSAKLADNTFRQKLMELAPNWVTLNNDDGFLDWLETFNPLAGKSYGDVLDEAYAMKDADRAATIFNLYSQPEIPSADAETPKKETPNIAPDKGSTGKTTKTTKTPKIYTGAEVERFYQDVQKGIYKSKPEMMKKIEAEINLAAAERRIRG